MAKGKGEEDTFEPKHTPCPLFFKGFFCCFSSSEKNIPRTCPFFSSSWVLHHLLILANPRWVMGPEESTSTHHQTTPMEKNGGHFLFHQFFLFRQKN